MLQERVNRTRGRRCFFQLSLFSLKTVLKGLRRKFLTTILEDGVLILLMLPLSGLTVHPESVIGRQIL